MIIKSLSRRSKSFGQLLGYIQKGAENQKEPVEIFHNMPFLDDGKTAIRKAFEENSQYLQKRKNGVALYHEIISLHPDDAEKITPQILTDISDKYLSLRAPENLAYGLAHTNTKNPHIHIMISANTISSPQKIRLSKAKFQRVKDHIYQYIQKHHPELKHTLQANTGRKISRISRAEKGMNKRNKKDKYVSKKDQIKQIVKVAINQEKNFPGLERNLQNQNIQLYTRGKQQGVIWKGKKYRLKTLGLAETLKERKKSWVLVKKRKKSVQHIFMEKVIRDWKSKGFRERLLQTIETKKQNKNFLQLRKIAGRKQRNSALGKNFYKFSRGDNRSISNTF